MIKGGYTNMVDNWSLGVILYVMLSGWPPFFGNTKKEILKKVYKGNYTFHLPPFMNCSLEVKDLIAKLLVRKPNQRFEAIQAFHHPWVQQQVDFESRQLEIEKKVINDLTKFTCLEK